MRHAQRGRQCLRVAQRVIEEVDKEGNQNASANAREHPSASSSITRLVSGYAL